MNPTIQFLAPSLILLLGVSDDLWSRKIHNSLVVTLLILGLALQILGGDGESLLLGAWGLVTALVIMLPLFFFGVVGGGDAKLMLAFGLLTRPGVVMSTLVHGFFWGGVLGILVALMHGRMLPVAVNFMLKTTENTEGHRIPFSVALYLGWLSHTTWPLF